MIEDCIEMVMN